MKRFSMIVLGMLSTTACTILFAGLANAQTATDVQCSGCVDRSDIASQAISSSKLKGQSVIRSKIQDNAVNDAKLSVGLRDRIVNLEATVAANEVADDSVSTAKIQDGAVTASKIAADAVGVTQIDPTQVQMRVGGSCAVGSYIAAVAEDGSVTCETGSIGDNTLYGRFAFASNTTGFQNTATGFQSLNLNDAGADNTATGAKALFSNTTGNSSTASGFRSLYSNTTGFQNTAYGVDTLYTNTTGILNTAGGIYALFANTDGSQNTANGAGALNANTTGSSNTASGANALVANTTGNDNIAIGAYAGEFLTTGDRNIAIGHPGVADDSNTIRVGNANHTRVFVHGIQGRTTGIDDAVTVVIDSNGQMGTMSSSRRYKQDINDMGQASDRLLQLRPVTFRYQEAYENGEQPLDYGLIAEEVAEVFPELVVFNKEGQPETVKYRLLSSLLLNELKKQDAVNDSQDVQLAALKGELADLKQLVGQMAALQALPSHSLVALNEKE